MDARSGFPQLYAPLWLAVPIHLLWRQQRSFANGGVYLFLVSFVVMYAVLAGILA
ncbi:hypothetical protein [Stenotrophomonas lactitubi]